MKTIVLGVGNPILGDDGAALHVIRQLKEHPLNKKVTIDDESTGGMNLLDCMLGYEKAIIIDVVQSRQAHPGTVQRIPFHKLTSIHSCNPHDVSLGEAITLAKKLGETRLPKEIILIAIMMKQMPLEFTESLSREITAAIPKALELTLAEIKKMEN